jgi:PKD repeat protein
MGTIWVLLGGDVSVIPHRGCYGLVQSGSGPVEDFDIPCDLYYAEIDRNWDLDDDGIWGEVEDIAGQLHADVWLGRAPVDNVSEASVFVDKVIAYERATSTVYQTDMLFLAEYLDAETDQAILKDMIDDESVPAQFDPITKLYESSGNLNRSDALDELNSGHNCVNHAGHGNTTGMSIGPGSLSNSDMLGLTNAPEYSVLSSLGCYCGAFDANSILEQFLLSPSGGGFAVGNSRYGWYSPGSPGWGVGDRYDREFWRVLFNEDDYWIGKTLAQAKGPFVGASGSYGAHRWTQFCLNLLGDPEMPIFTEQPVAMSVQHVDTVPLGSSQLVITVDDGSPLHHAFVCAMKEDEVYEVGMTDPQGEVTLHVSPQTGDTLWITVTARNHVPYEGYAVISGHAPPVAAFVANQTSGLAPLGIQFQSQSEGFIDTWYWQFGDGEESYEEDPLHTYQECGRYDVTHVACGPAGCDTAFEDTYIWVWADTLVVEDAYAVPGQPGKNVWIRGIKCDSLSGYGFAMYFDTTYVMVDSVTLDGTAGEGALISIGGVDSTEGYVTWGVVYGFTSPWIPAGDDYLFNVSVTVKPGVAIPSTTWLDLENEIGLADNTFTPWNGGDVFPHLIDGRLIIVDEVSFLRGDANGDSGISMADAVYLLRHLYVPGTPTPQCMDAVDSDDDGAIAMSDGIYLLRYLYVPGNPAPPAPCCVYPGDCGTDPTPDELYCGSHPCNSR